MSDAVIQKLDEGFAAQQSGDLPLAQRCYMQVLDIDPDNVHALNLLGVVHLSQFQHDPAVHYLSRALAADCSNPQTHTNIGLAYNGLGDKRKAAHHFRESIKLDPNFPDAYNNLGNVLRTIDQLEEAISSYKKALKLAPDFTQCWCNLAESLVEADQLDAAAQAVDRALQINSHEARAFKVRGDIYRLQLRNEEAFLEYARAAEFEPTYAKPQIELARLQREMDAPDEAMETLRDVLEMEPFNSEALLLQGIVHEQMGDRSSAAASIQAAIGASPELAAAHYHLSQIRGRETSDPEFEAMRKLWDEADLNSDARMNLAFGLYRAYEHRHRYDEAFSYIDKGNCIAAGKAPYDDEEAAREFEAIHTCTEAAISRLGGRPGRPDPRPVFVVGMPRSGTSLTEQILASHSQVAGAGEVSYGYATVQATLELTGEKFPDNMARLSAEQCESLGDYYIGRHSPDNLEAKFVVDKWPLNFLNIGLLALALPDAKFIHCHRNPVANCFSIYRMPFDKRHTYAHELDSLGRYYTRYWKLMQRWHDLFPGRILDVRYEDTVSDLETQCRRVLRFLDLPFEERVLEYYKTERLVRTPSASQVREPIYTDSVAAWEKYEKHLAGLIENLGVDLRG